MTSGFHCEVCAAEIAQNEPMVSVTRAIERVADGFHIDVDEAVGIQIFCMRCRPTDEEIRQALDTVVYRVRDRLQESLSSPSRNGGGEDR